MYSSDEINKTVMQTGYAVVVMHMLNETGLWRQVKTGLTGDAHKYIHCDGLNACSKINIYV